MRNLTSWLMCVLVAGCSVDKLSTTSSRLSGTGLTGEYFAGSGDARLGLSWSSSRLPLQAIPTSQLFPRVAQQPTGGLTGEYFAGAAFDRLVLTRVDGQVSFAWGPGSPDPAVPADQFS